MAEVKVGSEIPCSICDDEYKYTEPADAEYNTRLYCSTDCANMGEKKRQVALKKLQATNRYSTSAKILEVPTIAEIQALSKKVTESVPQHTQQFRYRMMQSMLDLIRRINNHDKNELLKEIPKFNKNNTATWIPSRDIFKYWLTERAKMGIAQSTLENNAKNLIAAVKLYCSVSKDYGWLTMNQEAGQAVEGDHSTLQAFLTELGKELELAPKHSTPPVWNVDLQQIFLFQCGSGQWESSMNRNAFQLAAIDAARCRPYAEGEEFELSGGRERDNTWLHRTKLKIFDEYAKYKMPTEYQQMQVQEPAKTELWLISNKPEDVGAKEYNSDDEDFKPEEEGSSGSGSSSDTSSQTLRQEQDTMSDLDDLLDDEPLSKRFGGQPVEFVSRSGQKRTAEEAELDNNWD